MPVTMLLVGTRKGCFVLESDRPAGLEATRPLCESWPVYHAVHDRGSGTISPPRRASGMARASGAAPTSARPGSCRARA